MATSRVTVECYAGGAYPTQPRAFTTHGVRHIVTNITRSWRTPNAIWFRVCTEQATLFSLAFYNDEDAWIVLPGNSTEEDQR